MSIPSSTLAGSSPAAQHQQLASTDLAGPSTPQNTQTNGDVKMNGDTPPKPSTEKEVDGEPDLSALFAARREEEMARKDRSLAEFLVMLDGYKPLVLPFLSERAALTGRSQTR